MKNKQIKTTSHIKYQMKLTQNTTRPFSSSSEQHKKEPEGPLPPVLLWWLCKESPQQGAAAAVQQQSQQRLNATFINVVCQDINYLPQWGGLIMLDRIYNPMPSNWFHVKDEFFLALSCQSVSSHFFRAYMGLDEPAHLHRRVVCSCGKLLSCYPFLLNCWLRRSI